MKSLTVVTLGFLLGGVNLIQAHPSSERHVNRPCEDIANEVAERIEANPEEILSVVAKYVAEYENCSGEIVGSAINASNASDELVGQIVEVAGTTAPGQINEIARAAYAASPGARGEISDAASGVPAMSSSGKSGMANDTAPGGFDPAVAFPSNDIVNFVMDPPSFANLGGGILPGQFPGIPNVVTDPFVAPAPF